MTLMADLPDFQAEAEQITRRRKLAEALAQQYGGPGAFPAGQMVSGRFVPTSPFTHIAGALRGLGAQAEMGQLDQQQKALGKRRNEALAGFLSRMPTARQETVPGVEDDSGFFSTEQRTVQPAMADYSGWMAQGAQIGPDAVGIGNTMLGLQQKAVEGAENRATRLHERILTLDAAAQNAALSREERAARALEAGQLRRELQQSQQEFMGNQNRQAAADRAAQARMMAGITAANRQPQVINTGSGPMVLQGTQAVPITGPGGAQVPPASARGTGQLSAAAQKELIQTDEELQGAQAALGLFKQAKEINDKAMGFTGAGYVASAGSLLPEFMRPATVDATQNLDNMLQSAALPQLKAIFGGMPTEGERKILLDVQGSSSKPPAVRKEIFDRAEKAIQARMKFAQEKAKALRSGTYFNESGAPTTVFGVQPTGDWTVVR